MVDAMAVADDRGRELTANQGGTMVLRNLLLTVHILGVIVWLGAKQAIMMLVLAVMVCMVPTFVATAKATAALDRSGGSVPEHARQLLAKVERYVVPMRIGALVAVVLAVWRPIA